MFNYGNANEAQKEAISATDGLVLITAGPGTGKTFTLVKRDRKSTRLNSSHRT